MSIRKQDSSSPRYYPPLRWVVVLIFALAAILSVPGCGVSLELTSEWTGGEVTVDGISADWSDLQTRIVGPDVRIGVKNDKDNVYVCLTTPSRTTQFQMLALGTTVWFDAEGKKNKTLGIQFPVKGLLQGRRLSPPGNTDEGKRIMQNLVNAAQRQFEIIGPGAGERKKIADRQAKGIDVHLGYDNGMLTYELKIPLQRTANQPYGVTLDPAKSIMIGFETGSYADAMGSQISAPGPAPGGGGGGRGGRGGGGGGTAISGASTPEGLKHWLTVQLAGESTGTTK